MNEPTDMELPPEDVITPAKPGWIERLRPGLLWLAPITPIAAVFAAGLPFGGWRELSAAAHSTDLYTLIPGFRVDLEPLSAMLPRLATTSAFAALIGILTWLWRASTPGFGFFAGAAAFWLSLAIEIARWLKPAELPDFRDPLIAASVAFIVWRLLRYLPDQPVTPLPRHSACGIRRRVLAFLCVASVAAGIGVIAVCLPAAIDHYAYAPAQAAELVVALPDGHSGFPYVVTGAIAQSVSGIGVVKWLRQANHLTHGEGIPPPNWTGAAPSHDGVLPPGRLRSVASIEALRQAIDTADPGDVILMQPGTYSIRGSYITFRRPGTSAAPITLRAPRLGLVTIDSDLPEALKVAAPYWRFENFIMRGVCGDDSACDNGFHIVGKAEGTILRNLSLEDFNAQIKINGEDGAFPDNGRIEYSSLIDRHPRKTNAPVTPIDLVAANGWVIENNLIADFVKSSGNTVSYGAFAKGAAHGTVFTRNVVLCEWTLHGVNGQSIGLSFGGGATGPQFRRDNGRSNYEHADGVIAGNLIAFCSDDAIYLNRAVNTVIRHNTMIATSGIDVRYAESTAAIDANVVDGPIRARDDGLFWGEGNQSASLIGMFLGRNPVRALFADPARLDLRWTRIPELVKPESGPDLCGVEWTEAAPAGAFQNFEACRQADRTRP